MNAKVSNSAALRQDEPCALADAAEGKTVSLIEKLHLIRRAIDDSGWKHTAIAAVLGVTPQYLSRQLDGEKPWTLRHQDALPDEVEAIYARLYAEHLGLIAVAVPTSAEQARRDLVSGLFGLLHRLPEKAATFAKAELTPTAARKVTA